MSLDIVSPTFDLVKTERILGSSDAVLSVSTTLSRLCKLDSQISHEREDRSFILRLLHEIWNKAKIDLKNSPDKVRKQVESELQKMGPSISQLFLIPFENHEMEKCIYRNIKDLNSITIPPLRKSHRGNKGPTFLVSYPRFENSSQNARHDSYVVKWTNTNEILCNRVYDAFSRCFTELDLEDDAAPIGFLVPKAAGIDFESRVHLLSNGDNTILSRDLNQALKKNFLNVIESYYPGLIPNDPHIMLSERICGENLFDFALTKYTAISPNQKKVLFNRLGRLALFDFVMGNLDRLVQVTTDKKGNYVLEDLEANLGNVMVVCLDDFEPILYSIDNGINQELIDSAECRLKYVAFMREFLANPGFIDTITANIIESFDHALATQVDEVEGNVLEAKKRLKTFQSDLQPIALPAFKQGIDEMITELQKLMCTWESDASKGLKNNIASIYPELLIAIQERFDAFKFARTKS